MIAYWHTPRKYVNYHQLKAFFNILFNRAFYTTLNSTLLDIKIYIFHAYMEQLLVVHFFFFFSNSKIFLFFCYEKKKNGKIILFFF